YDPLSAYAFSMSSPLIVAAFASLFCVSSMRLARSWSAGASWAIGIWKRVLAYVLFTVVGIAAAVGVWLGAALISRIFQSFGITARSAGNSVAMWAGDSSTASSSQPMNPF